MSISSAAVDAAEAAEQSLYPRDVCMHLRLTHVTSTSLHLRSMTPHAQLGSSSSWFSPRTSLNQPCSPQYLPNGVRTTTRRRLVSKFRSLNMETSRSCSCVLKLSKLPTTSHRLCQTNDVCTRGEEDGVPAHMYGSDAEHLAYWHWPVRPDCLAKSNVGNLATALPL